MDTQFVITRPTPDELRLMIKKHGITRETAAGMVHTGARTLHSWLAPIDSKAHSPIPLATWELLLIKLNEHTVYKSVDKQEQCVYSSIHGD